MMLVENYVTAFIKERTLQLPQMDTALILLDNSQGEPTHNQNLYGNIVEVSCNIFDYLPENKLNRHVWHEMRSPVFRVKLLQLIQMENAIYKVGEIWTCPIQKIGFIITRWGYAQETRRKV